MYSVTQLIPAQPFTSCVTLRKFTTHSCLCFPIYPMGQISDPISQGCFTQHSAWHRISTLYIFFLSILFIILKVQHTLGMGLPQWFSNKESTCKQKMRPEPRVRSLGQEDPLEKEMATHSSILAWKIPWTEETGVLQSMESQRVGRDLTTKRKKKKKPQHIRW